MEEKFTLTSLVDTVFLLVHPEWVLNVEVVVESVHARILVEIADLVVGVVVAVEVASAVAVVVVAIVVVVVVVVVIVVSVAVDEIAVLAVLAVGRVGSVLTVVELAVSWAVAVVGLNLEVVLSLHSSVVELLYGHTVNEELWVDLVDGRQDHSLGVGAVHDGDVESVDELSGIHTVTSPASSPVEGIEILGKEEEVEQGDSLLSLVVAHNVEHLVPGGFALGDLLLHGLHGLRVREVGGFLVNIEVVSDLLLFLVVVLLMDVPHQSENLQLSLQEILVSWDHSTVVITTIGSVSAQMVGSESHRGAQAQRNEPRTHGEQLEVKDAFSRTAQSFYTKSS